MQFVCNLNLNSLIYIFSTGKQILVDHIQAFPEASEMDFGSEERTSGCGYYNLTTPAPLPTKINVDTTLQPKTPIRPVVYRGEFKVLYMPSGAMESVQNSGTEAQRRYLNSLKNALANREIRPIEIRDGSSQFFKPNSENTQIKPPTTAQGDPTPNSGNVESDLSKVLVQALRKWIEQQTGNQGPSQNQLPQRGSNQSNSPQGASPQGGSNQNNFPQGVSPQSGSNQNNFAQGGPNQNNFPQSGSPQGEIKQNNLAQTGAPLSLYQFLMKIGQKQ